MTCLCRNSRSSMAKIPQSKLEQLFWGEEVQDCMSRNQNCNSGRIIKYQIILHTTLYTW